jgi:hypothetical protein
MSEFFPQTIEVAAAPDAHSVSFKQVPTGAPSPCVGHPGTDCVLVVQNHEGYDYYIVHCPYGPPCP